jgi:hypothetical protein
MEVDTALYMESYVIGLFARFINGDDEFLPDPETSKRLGPKQYDLKSQNNAKRFLKSLINRKRGIDPAVLRARGYAYRRAYRVASTYVNTSLAHSSPDVAGLLNGDWLSFSDYTVVEDDEEETEENEDNSENSENSDNSRILQQYQQDPDSRVVEQLVERARLRARYLCDNQDENNFNRELAQRIGIHTDGSDEKDTAHTLYAAVARWTAPARPVRGKVVSLRTEIMACLGRREAALRREIASAVPQASAAASRFEAGLELLVTQRRAIEHATAPEKLGDYPNSEKLIGDDPGEFRINEFALDEDEVNALRQLRVSWILLVGVFAIRERDQRMQQYLTALKRKRVGIPMTMSRAEAKRLAADAASKTTSLNLPNGGI